MIDNKFIAVSYKLYTNNDVDNPAEEATKEQPFVFISELGMSLDKFEENIKDIKIGEDFDFIISCDEAYGMPDQERIIAFPRGVFEIDGKFDSEHVKVGNFLPMNNTDGQRLIGKVIELTDSMVLIDFNHPFAGFDLHFVGTIIENRTATNDELKQAIKLISGGGGCGHCGGTCGGNCGNDCGGGCSGNDKHCNK